MEAAGRAAKEFDAEIAVVKKTAKEYAKERDPLPRPSVVLNGRVIAKNDIIAYEAIKTSLSGDSDIQVGHL